MSPTPKPPAKARDDRADGRGPGRRTPERRAEILSAALREFTATGYAATSLRSIAERADVSHPAVLHHFGSKRELFFAVLEEQEAEDTVLVASLADARKIDELVDAYVAVLEKYRRNPGLSRLWTGLAMAAAGSDKDPAHAFVARRYARWTEGIAVQVRRGQAHGFIDPSVKPELAAVAILSLLDGLQTQATADSGVDTRPVLLQGFRMLAVFDNTDAR